MNWRSERHADAVSKIIKRLDALLRVNPDRSVTLGWENELDYGASIVAASATLSEHIREEQRIDLARRAIIDAKKAGTLTPAAVLADLRKKQRSYLSRPPQAYVLVSSLSVRFTESLTTTRPYGVTITFSSVIPKRFRPPRRLAGSFSHAERRPFGYTTVRSTVRARDVMSAGDQAIEGLDFLRAVWNLLYNYGRRRISFGGAAGKPFNDIVAGPIHTLHHASGQPVEQVYWREAPRLRELSAKSIDSDYDRLKDFEALVRSQLRKSRMEQTLVRLLIRYGRALDESDPSSAYLKLWAILEDITDSPPGGYDQLVRRTCFLMKDAEYTRLVLNYLKTWRNRIVHDSDRPTNVEVMINDLKRYVETLLLFLIRHPHDFHTLQEYGQFLSLPSIPKELRRRLTMLQLATRLK